MYDAQNIQSTRKRNMWRVAAAIALVIFVCSLAALGVIAFSYWQGQHAYDEIATLYANDTPEGERDIDWEALAAINPDIVGWIRVPNTVIDYPVVQGGDNQYYLGHDFSGQQGWLAQYGCIFLEYKNDPTFADEASFIYGHHMNDGSMFSAIGTMRTQDDFDHRKKAILYTPNATYRLKAFSLVYCSGSEDIVTTEFASADDRTQYIKEMVERSEFDPGSTPPAESIEKIIALATCDDSVGTPGRYVMFCYIE